MSYLIYHILKILLLGFEVDKLSKISTKKSNTTYYIELDIQNTKTPRIDDPII